MLGFLKVRNPTIKNPSEILFLRIEYLINLGGRNEFDKLGIFMFWTCFSQEITYKKS